MPVMRWRVVCALREVMLIFWPTSALSKVDLPTLGLPTMAIRPQRCSPSGGTSTAGSAAPRLAKACASMASSAAGLWPEGLDNSPALPAGFWGSLGGDSLLPVLMISLGVGLQRGSAESGIQCLDKHQHGRRCRLFAGPARIPDAAFSPAEFTNFAFHVESLLVRRTHGAYHPVNRQVHFAPLQPLLQFGFRIFADGLHVGVDFHILEQATHQLVSLFKARVEVDRAYHRFQGIRQDGRALLPARFGLAFTQAQHVG